MDWATFQRKVKRRFGDEFNIIITSQDVADWANSAQSDIVRETQCLPKTITALANEFPITITDLYLMSRASYGDPEAPKEFTTLEEIDAQASWFPGFLAPSGIPTNYYVSGNVVNLYPQPLTTDTTVVTVTYVRAPKEIRLIDPWFFYTNKANKTVQVTESGDQFAIPDTCFMVINDIAPTSWTNAFIISSVWGDTDPTKAWRFKKNSDQSLQLEVFNGTAATTWLSPSTMPVLSAGGRRKTAFKFVPLGASDRVDFYYSDNDGITWTGLGSDTETFTSMQNPASAVLELGSFGIGEATDLFTGKHYGIQLYQFSDPDDNAVPTGFIYLDIDTERDFPGSLDSTSDTSYTTGFGQTVSWNSLSTFITNRETAIDVPEMYHEDMVKYCIARAHEKNENYQAQQILDESFNENVSQRRFEALQGDETFPSIRPDPMDWM